MGDSTRKTACDCKVYLVDRQRAYPQGPRAQQGTCPMKLDEGTCPMKLDERDE